MKTSRLTICQFFLAQIAVWMMVVSLAAQMPQDHWYDSGHKIPGSFLGVALDDQGNVYSLATSSSNERSGQIVVHTPEGKLIRTLASVGRYAGMVYHPEGLLIVSDMAADPSVMVYNAVDGGLVATMATHGEGEGQITRPERLIRGVAQLAGVLPDGNLVILDPGGRRVHIFTTAGQRIRSFGQSGTLIGQFPEDLMSVVCHPDGTILIQDQNGWSSFMFNAEGDFLGDLHIPIGGNQAIFGVTPDGLIIANNTGGSDRFGFLVGDVWNLVQPLDGNSGENFFYFWSDYLEGSGHRTRGAASNLKGDIWVSTGLELRLFHRHFAPVDPPLQPSALPQVQVLKSAQRSGTSLTDIHFRILDEDSPNVAVGILAFEDGQDQFDKIIIPQTFVEGTSWSLGQMVAAGERIEVAWDTAADWNSTYGYLQVEILAKDDRSLLPFHWITVPAVDEQPEFRMSRGPLANADFYPVWLWLIASGSPDVVLQDGRVFGVSGQYEGLALTDTNRGTTASGRAFMLQKLGVRAATATEITQASSGRYGFTGVGAQSVVLP